MYQIKIVFVSEDQPQDWEYLEEDGKEWRHVREGVGSTTLSYVQHDGEATFITPSGCTKYRRDGDWLIVVPSSHTH